MQTILEDRLRAFLVFFEELRKVDGLVDAQALQLLDVLHVRLWRLLTQHEAGHLEPLEGRQYELFVLAAACGGGDVRRGDSGVPECNTG